MTTKRVANPSRAERLFKLRRAQIEAAYQDRLDPNMSKKARRALEDERTRQLALARSEFARLSHAKPPAKKKGKITIKKAPTFERRPIKPVPPRKTRQIPVGGIAHMIDTSGRKPPPPREEMPVSDKWTYFDRDTGAPVSPWEIDVGPQYDDDEGETPFESGEVFADEDYSYADIEADWGGYDYHDTGYADENA